MVVSELLAPDIADADPRCRAYLQRAGWRDGRSGSPHMRDLGDDTWVMAYPLLFHWTVTRGLFDDPVGYVDRWCYADAAGALEALAAFPMYPPADYEPTGWHRHPGSGRRRPGGEPALEFRKR